MKIFYMTTAALLAILAGITQLVAFSYGMHALVEVGVLSGIAFILLLIGLRRGL